MTALTASIVIVSRGRPALLQRCLTGVSQLCFDRFEVVVVSDQSGLDAVSRAGLSGRIKTRAFDEENISAARNVGIKAASGAVIAFLDDDAVPEPTWLDHLIAPFEDPGVAATSGYVRGRNGIAFQWRARVVNETGFAREVEAHGTAPFTPETGAREAVKTEGTNVAVRRSVLAEIGGFDPAFRFFLDETDVDMRLAGAGHRTVLVPLAQVHHGYAASARRGADRAPRDLFEVGASSAVFLRKHAAEPLRQPALDAFALEQRQRLVTHMVDGGIEPRGVSRVLGTLLDGMQAGQTREIPALPPLADPPDDFLPFASLVARSGETRQLSGRPWNRRRLRAEARNHVQNGHITSVFRFSPTALPHHLVFSKDGYWEQHGGLFGRAERDEPFFRLRGFRSRLHKEWARVQKLRKCENAPGLSGDAGGKGG